MAKVELPDMPANSFEEPKPKKAPERAEGEAREKVKPVIQPSSIVQKKKTLGQKFAETFVTEDVDNIGQYVVKEVVVPGIKNTILDVLSMAFFGETGGYRRSGKGGNYYDRSDRVSYSTYYDRSNRGRRDSRRDHDYDDRNRKADYRSIVLRKRSDAQNVVSDLRYRIEKYGDANVADLLDLCGLESDYTDIHWGWTDPRDIGMRQVSNGWLIDVCEALYID